MRITSNVAAFLMAALFILPMPLFAQEEEASPEPDPAVVETAVEAEAAEVVVAEEDTEFWDAFYFLGRFHPLVLHFPIGVLVGLFILEVFALFRGLGRDNDLARWLLLVIGTSMAILASTFGWFLEWTGGYDEETVFTHRWTGVTVAVAASLALLLRIQYVRSYRDRYLWLYRLALIVSVGALLPSGHSGASLTHGSTYLTKYLPEQLAFLEPVLGEAPVIPASSLGSSMFEQTILPIFEAKCIECHGADKQKGDYRMDSRELCIEGGETLKPAIVPGNAIASYLVEVVLLPPEHKDVMPPIGEKMLEDEEVLSIITWINRGAPWGEYTPPSDEELARVAEEAAAALAAEELAEGGGETLTLALVDCSEVMQMFFETQYESLRTGLWKEPQRRAEFKAIYATVFGLAEAHNLVYSRTDEDYMLTQAWVDLTTEGRDAAMALGESVTTRDYEGMKTGFVALGESCNKCHVKFVPDEDLVSLEIGPPEEEEEK